MEHSHHLVILVGQDVAMPYVTARLVERRLDPGDVAPAAWFGATLRNLLENPDLVDW